MKLPVVTDVKLIAACGLYCAGCYKFRSGKCPGCAGNEKAAWCKIRSCCLGKDIANCSLCEEYSTPKACAKYNNFMARLFGFIFQSDREECINFLKENGADNYAAFMAGKEWVSFPKKK
jgi:hypothetical protein